jgi:glutathione S-transferase
VLVDGALVLPESAVICEYVEERFPGPPLWPAELQARARARVRVSRIDSELAPAYGKWVHGGGDPALQALHEILRALEPELPEDGFLEGDFTIADATLAPFVLGHRRVLPEDAPRLAAWAERVAARPSVQRHLERTPPPGWPPPM